MRKGLLCLMLLGALALTACGEAEGNNPPADTVAESSVTTEATEETTAEVTTTAPAPKTELVTIDADLSPLGEFIEKFVTITNDTSKKATKDEIFEYIKEKGYTCYPYHSSVDGVTITPEEAYENDSFIIKPDFISDYTQDIDHSYAVVLFDDDGYIRTVQYYYDEHNPETPEKIRTAINTVIEENSFEENEKIKVTRRYKGDDEDNWTGIYIKFKCENNANLLHIESYLNTSDCIITINFY